MPRSSVTGGIEEQEVSSVTSGVGKTVSGVGKTVSGVGIDKPFVTISSGTVSVSVVKASRARLMGGGTGVMIDT